MNNSMTDLLLKTGDFILLNDIDEKAEEVTEEWEDGKNNTGNIIITIKGYKKHED